MIGGQRGGDGQEIPLPGLTPEFFEIGFKRNIHVYRRPHEVLGNQEIRWTYSDLQLFHRAAGAASRFKRRAEGPGEGDAGSLIVFDDVDRDGPAGGWGTHEGCQDIWSRAEEPVEQSRRVRRGVRCSAERERRLSTPPGSCLVPRAERRLREERFQARP